MTTVETRNGGTIGVLGDVRVQNEDNGWAVEFLGPIVRIWPHGLLAHLSDTSASCIYPDNLDGHAKFRESPKEKEKTVGYLQIPPGAQTTWILLEDDVEFA